MPRGRCDHCQHEFGYTLIHHGDFDTAYAYCDRCSYSVHLERQLDPIKQLDFLLPYPQRMYEYVEPLLKHCPCGGSFRHFAEPKCPKCRQTLSARAPYLEENKPDALSAHWQWQRNWNGSYSIVIEAQVVNNWWDVEKLSRLQKKPRAA